MADFDHSHIAPAGYLRSWADGKHLAMRLVENPERAVPIAPKDAGVRRGFTRERQPDGSYKNHLDPMLAKLEDVAVPLWRDLDEHWPATGSVRAAIAELLAFQVVRSPAWRAFHNSQVPKHGARARADFPGRDERDYQEAEAALLSDQGRHDRLRWQGRLLTFVIVNMHWTLLRADGPQLVTSDHPVVALGIETYTGGAARAVPTAGLLNTLELRCASRPDLLMVMSWRDDGEELLPQALAERHVLDHNSSVIAQAERQWFHHPGISPQYGSDSGRAISMELHRGYGPDAARLSNRRMWVSSLLSDPIDYKRFAEKIPFMPWPVRQAA
jgi:hypothetical protein